LFGNHHHHGIWSSQDQASLKHFLASVAPVLQSPMVNESSYNGGNGGQQTESAQLLNTNYLDRHPMDDLSQDEVIHIDCCTSPIMKQGGNSLVRDPAATIHNGNINMTGSNSNVSGINLVYNNGRTVNYNSSKGNDDIVDTNQSTSHPNHQSRKHPNHQSGRDDQSMHVYREMGVLMLTMLLLLIIITNYTIFFIDL